MKNIIYAFLAILMLFSFNSCQNNKKIETKNADSLSTQREKSKLVVEYRIIEGLNKEDRCLELALRDSLNRKRIYFVEVDSNKFLPRKVTENYFYWYDNTNSASLTGEDENYKIYVDKYYYTTSTLIFEDKKTGHYYFTFTTTIKGIYMINNAYWIVQNGCHMGCYTEISRIKDPKKLFWIDKTDIKRIYKYIDSSSYEDRQEMYQEMEYMYSYDSLGQDFLGFIPYQNSMILFLNGRENRNNRFSVIQINEDKSIDTLENSFEGTMFGMPYDGCTILPKNQNFISFCSVVLEIENDTLFVYSLE
ncbi:hypothetical protein ACE193_04100 [Bernardetia sp. OM2101]|uniref:hypothetical protein n=1 Tax=Bernardetia sp. OM2101 TaxID=3344876 RepID=UPI0035D071B2